MNQIFQRRAWLAAGWLAAINLVVVAKLHPPDGKERAEVAQFLGRFHPLILHVPIALILLVPVLEWLGRAENRRHLRDTAGLVLGLAAVTALVAAYDGWLLGWSGGYQGPIVIRHLWGGVALATLTVLAATIRTLPRPGLAYALCLLATIGDLTWASHNGGSLTHGDTFLTDTMPARLRKLLHLAPRRTASPAKSGADGSAPGKGKSAKNSAAAKTVYAAQIQPIFDKSCVSCHGPKKKKGGLRLDTYALLEAGGDTGDEIEPWKPSDSELIRRINLDPDDDDFMPNNGKNLLTTDQKLLIKNWILAGASDRQPLP